MRTNQKGSIPVPPPGLAACRLNRFDGHSLAGLFVEALKSAILRLGVDDVGVAGINLRFKAVSGLGHVPVAVHNSSVVDGAARTSQREVILSSAINSIKWLGIVHRNPVKLRNRQVLLVVPGLAVVPGLINPSVAAQYQVLGIRRVLPKSMVVDVLVLFAKALERSSAVFGPLHVGVHTVQSVGIASRRD